MAAALVIGTFAREPRVWGGPFLVPLAGAYVEFFRNTPFLVQVRFFAVAVRAGRTSGSPATRCSSGSSRSRCTRAPSSPRSSARASCRSIPRQIEAARSLGLSQVAALRLVVLPQAIRIGLPPLGNLSIALVKNSSIVYAIAAPRAAVHGPA